MAFVSFENAGGSSYSGRVGIEFSPNIIDETFALSANRCLLPEPRIWHPERCSASAVYSLRTGVWAWLKLSRAHGLIDPGKRPSRQSTKRHAHPLRPAGRLLTGVPRPGLLNSQTPPFRRTRPRDTLRHSRSAKQGEFDSRQLSKYISFPINHFQPSPSRLSRAPQLP